MELQPGQYLTPEERAVIADLLNAVDPDLTEQQREDAAMRALKADAELALWNAAVMLREALVAIATGRGEPPNAGVRSLRRSYAVVPDHPHG